MTFQSDVATRKSLYGQLNEYRFLVNTNHYDKEDEVLYQITKIDWWKSPSGSMHIVAHRTQCKFQHGFCIDVPEADYISIEEAITGKMKRHFRD